MIGLRISLRTFIVGVLFIGALIPVYLRRDPWERIAEGPIPVVSNSRSSSLAVSEDNCRIVLINANHVLFYDWNGSGTVTLRWSTLWKSNLLHTLAVELSESDVVMATGDPLKKGRVSRGPKVPEMDVEAAAFFDHNYGDLITDSERLSVLRAKATAYIAKHPAPIDSKGEYSSSPGTRYFSWVVSRLTYREYGGHISALGDRAIEGGEYRNVLILIPPVDYRAESLLYKFPIEGSAAHFTSDGEHAVIASFEKLFIYRRRFPEWWWGHFYRGEVWLAIGLGLALVYSATRRK